MCMGEDSTSPIHIGKFPFMFHVAATVYLTCRSNFFGIRCCLLMYCVFILRHQYSNVRKNRNEIEHICTREDFSSPVHIWEQFHLCFMSLRQYNFLKVGPNFLGILCCLFMCCVCILSGRTRSRVCRKG